LRCLQFINGLLGIMEQPEARTAYDMHIPLKCQRLGQDGATAIEYAMVALFISIAIVSALVTVGTSVSHIFSTVATSF
jgi:Flp pilus assembly pilin Flp